MRTTIDKAGRVVIPAAVRERAGRGPPPHPGARLAGRSDFGPQSAPAQHVLHAVAEKIVTSPGTAWHCCLEFYSVATRLPPEYRLTPPAAEHLLEDEVLRRMTVQDLPGSDRLP